MTTNWILPCSLALSLAAFGCGDDDAMGDGGRVDGGADGGDADGGGRDGGTNDDGGRDGGTSDAGGSDGGTSDAGEIDAGSFDGGPPSSCTAAGGACVAVVPGACADGVVGTPDWYSCGGGLGVLCCLPASTAPVCRALGTRSEGWYRPDGTRVCYTNCAGHSASCEAVGTRSEGWYTDAASAGCSAIPVDRLIEWTMCAP